VKEEDFFPAASRSTPFSEERFRDLLRNRPQLKVSWKAIAGVAISSFFIWWVLRGEDLGEILIQVSGANPWYFSAAIFVSTAGFVIRAWRWKVLLHPLKESTRFRSRFASISVGFAANNILPARLGEVARALVLSLVESVPAAGAFGSLVVERFLDAVVLLSFFLLPMAFPSFPRVDGLLSGGVVGTLLQATFGMLAVFFLGMVALLISPESVVRVVEWFCRRLPDKVGRPIVTALEVFLQALKVLRHPVLLTKAVLWSYSFWLWHTLSFWLAFRAFGIDLGFEAAMFSMAAVGFAVAIPAAPGFFGTFQLGTDLALSGVYGVAEPTALAFSFGYHLGGFVPITIIGLYYASRLGFSLKDLRSSQPLLEGEAPVEAPGEATLVDREP
jgi:uncharacterized protein (TIRG00374 family)